MTISAGNGNAWNIYSPITGTDPLVLTGGAQLSFRGTNSNFSGTLVVSNVGCRLYVTNCLGTGPVTLGSGSTFASIWPEASVTFGYPSQTITVGAGTGARQITAQLNGLSATFAPQWVLNTNLALMMNSPASAPSRVTFNGNISGNGGLRTLGTTNDTYVLAGLNTYLGPTLCTTGTVTINGRQGNGRIVVGTGSSNAVLNGTGAIALNDNEAVLVGSNGTLYIGGRDGIRFDLTQLTGKTNILVTYTNGTLLDLPGNVQDLMTYSSTNAGMILEVTNYQIRTKSGTPALSPPILATNTWTGLAGGGNWSAAGNWSLNEVPNLNHQVVMGISAVTTVDVSLAAGALTLATNITLTSSGGAILTLYRTFSKAGAINSAQAIGVPIQLGSEVIITNLNAGRELAFNSAFSGPHRLSAKTMGTQLRLLANSPAFSGELAIYNSSICFNNGGLGTGPVTMGSGDGSGAAVLFYYSGGVYSASTNIVTVQPGTGARTVYSQTASAVTLPLTFVLNKDLTINDLPASAQCTLSGPISGPAGIVKDNLSLGGTLSTGILSGVCSYLGATVVKQGTLTINGSLTNANITIGHTSVVARLNGAGIIAFRPGNVIDVNTNGTLDATALRFDIMAITSTPAVLVDFSHQGVFSGPSPLKNLLTATSKLNFDVTDTGTQIVATRTWGSVFSIR
jgi:hypothetical protein